MAKPTVDELNRIITDLDLVSDEIWNRSLSKSKNENKSVWKLLFEEDYLTKKQVDTMDMCSKGYIPINVAKVTVSMDKQKAKDRKAQNKANFSGEPDAEFISSESSVTPIVRTLDSSSLIEKITSKKASTPIEDLYKSGEVRRLTNEYLEPPTKKAGIKTTEFQYSSAPLKQDQKADIKDDLSHLIGKKIGKFQLSRKLREGSIGTVFLADHTILNMPVAIKILDPELATASPEVKDRFMHEARSSARINHPNVIRVLDCDFIDGFYMIVMEYIDGISLAELISTNGAIGEDKALNYILAVAEGLEAACKMGIIHRDIKPANILVTENKQIRIAEMGLSRTVIEESIIDSQHGVGLGNPQCFPPEQARDASSADHRSDIYALGITLYVLLAGELPFKGKTILELIRQHEEEYAIPLNVLNPSITQRTTNLVIRMIQKNPKDRYQSYDELIQAIQACVVECQTRSEDIGAGSSKQGISMLDKIGSMFGQKK